MGGSQPHQLVAGHSQRLKTIYRHQADFRRAHLERAARTCSLGKVRLPYHSLKARFLAERIEQRVDLKEHEVGVTLALRDFQPFERSRDISLLRVHLGVGVGFCIAIRCSGFGEVRLSVRVAPELVVGHRQAYLTGRIVRLAVA